MGALDAARAIGRDDRRAHARDFASRDAGLSLVQLESFLVDLKNEPAWRRDADVCADYYDGNQLSADVLAKLEERGLGPLMDNLVKPTIDAVLGMEARTRGDWRVVADDEAHQDVAEALAAKIKEAERESHADRACTDAYAQQVKSGFAAVEVSRSANPFDYPYRVQAIHRRELFWDWHSTKPDWSDARFILRKRWLDEDVAVAHFPEHRDLVRFAIHGWDQHSFEAELRDGENVAMLQRSLDQELRTSIDASEWKSAERRRVAVYECWYRTFHRGAAIRLPDNRVIEYDARNPQHIAAVAAGTVTPQFGVYDRMRCAFFIGPHRVADYGTHRRHAPYVPFWGYREDLTGIPYGLIRQMIPTQDEINARRAKLMWLLSSRRVLIDSDALDTAYNAHGDATAELARTDSYIVLNPNRVNRGTPIQIDDNLAASDKQSAILTELKQTFPQTAGVYSSMLGDAKSAGVTANSAIQSLIDQGTMTLASINDNYSYARRLVGERLLELIKEDLIGRPWRQSIDTGTSRKTVALNQPAVDPETGQQYLENDISAATVKVAIADIPQTPAYRQQQFAQIAEVAKSLPPETQGFVVPFLMEASDLPKRREIAKLLREKLGIADSNVDPNTPEGQQMAAAMQQQQQMQELQTRTLMADAALKEAQAAKAQAEAQAALNPAGGPDPAAMVAEAEERMRTEAAHAQQIAQLQAEVQASKQEAALKVAEIQANAQAEEARAAAERERAVIEAQAQVEIARVQADAQREQAAIQAEIEKIRVESERAVLDLQRTHDERVSGLREQFVQHQAKTAQERTREREAAAAAPKPAEPKPADDKPKTVVVQMAAPAAAKPAARRRIRVTRSPDGAFDIDVGGDESTNPGDAPPNP